MTQPKPRRTAQAETVNAGTMMARALAGAAGLAAMLAALALLTGASAAQSLQNVEVRFEGVPDEARVEAWSKAGVNHVVTLLTAEEIGAMSFDLDDAIAGSGMMSSWVPIGRQSGSEAADYLAEILADAEGPVVIHCRSGTRASHAYAASLIRAGVIGPTQLDQIDPGREWRDALVTQLAE